MTKAFRYISFYGSFKKKAVRHLKRFLRNGAFDKELASESILIKVEE